MNFNQDEISNLKAMLLFLVKKKQAESGGHNGFHLKELEPILKELEKDGQIERLSTINSTMYFLKK